MTLAGYLKIFRQRWWIIALSTVLAAAIVFVLTPANASDEPPVSSYTSTATLVASQGSNPASNVSLGRLVLFITTGEVPAMAAETLGFTEDPALLAGQVTVTPDEAAQAITISATAEEAQESADRANAFAAAAVEYFETQSGPTVTVLQDATPIPNTPTGGAVVPPSRTARTALAAIVGLLLGLALAIVLDHLDGRLRTRNQIGQATGLPIIAEVPKLGRKQRDSGSIVVRDAPLSPYADAYRAARSTLLHADAPHVSQAERAMESQSVSSTGTPPGGKVILVTSALAGEGKTTSVANIAASFAETGKEVLAIDGDLRKPDLHPHFDVPQGLGASDFLTDSRDAPLTSLMRPTNVPGVRIITAGTQLARPASLTSRMAPLIAAARQAADIVVLDASPILMASDAFDILPLVDTVLLVARSGRLTAVSAARAAELLNRFHVPVAGVVVIAAPKDSSRGYGYGYGYGTGYGEKDGGQREVTPATLPPQTDQAPAGKVQEPGGSARGDQTNPRRVLRH